MDFLRTSLKILALFFMIDLVSSESRYRSIEKCESNNVKHLTFENCAYDEIGLNFTFDIKIGTNICNVSLMELFKIQEIF